MKYVIWLIRRSNHSAYRLWSNACLCHEMHKLTYESNNIILPNVRIPQTASSDLWHIHTATALNHHIILIILTLQHHTTATPDRFPHSSTFGQIKAFSGCFRSLYKFLNVYKVVGLGCLCPCHRKKRLFDEKKFGTTQ